MAPPTAMYPYTITNSYRGGYFMRQNIRNVRRAWDGDDYQPLKRVRLEKYNTNLVGHAMPADSSAVAVLVDVEDNLERAIRETSVAALSTTSSRKNSTIFSLESREDDATDMTTPPSSPGPPAQLQLTPPNVKARKPTFSVLDKQKKQKAKQQTLKRKADDALAASAWEEPQALAEIHNSSQATPAASRPSSSFTGINTLFSREPDKAGRKSSPPTDKGTATVAITTTTTTTTTPATLQPAPARAKPTNLVQSVLDFGQSLKPVTCSQCGMTYTPSVAEDKALHEMFHHRHSDGIELGKGFLKSAMKWCYEVPNIPGAVVVVDRKISLPGRKVVQRVLEVVNKELGSLDIREEDLWSQRPVPGEDESKKYDRYKAFLHVLNGKCVGICLAERIHQAHRVLPETADEHMDSVATSTNRQQQLGDDVEMTDLDTTPRAKKPQPVSGCGGPSSDGGALPSPPRSTAPSSSITTSQDTVPAIVGVSRIWTSRAFRRKGIANNLLECVMNKFIYGMDIEKTEMAFSQPTESGARLARGWFGQPDGWRVYTED